MSLIRQERLESEITKALAEILPTLKDPRINGMVSTTAVRLTRDFSFADVILSVYGADKPEEVVEAIKHSAGFIRHELRNYIGNIHTLPQLRFSIDESEKKLNRINELLEKIKEKSNETH